MATRKITAPITSCSRRPVAAAGDQQQAQHHGQGARAVQPPDDLQQRAGQCLGRVGAGRRQRAEPGVDDQRAVGEEQPEPRQHPPRRRVGRQQAPGDQVGQHQGDAEDQRVVLQHVGHSERASGGGDDGVGQAHRAGGAQHLAGSLVAQGAMPFWPSAQHSPAPNARMAIASAHRGQGSTSIQVVPGLARHHGLQSNRPERHHGERRHDTAAGWAE